MIHRLLRNPIPLLAVLVLTCAGGCGGGGSSSAFVVRLTPWGVTAGTPIVISGRWLAFLATESVTGPAGTILNGDGDINDTVAVVVDTATNTRTELRAALALAWVGEHLYLVVPELDDGMEWNGVPGNQTVLLHWKAGTPVAFDLVDTVPDAPDARMVSTGSLLFFTSVRVPLNPFESNLRVVSAAFPFPGTAVATTDAVGPLSPRILGQDEGLVFLALDESVELRELNGDADLVPDDLVLALLDGEGVLGALAYDREAMNVGRALPSELAPRRARKLAAHDWQVGFLVSEAAQGATNFNVVNPAAPVELTAGWQPAHCLGFEDADTGDHVLFFLDWSDWLADPVADAPRNTGLVAKGGLDGVGRIAIANGFVAVISPESAEGTCDLNDDGDPLPDDDVVRMTRIVRRPAPILPIGAASRIQALKDVPGGTHGLAELAGRFVIVMSEAAQGQDLNDAGAGFDDDLVGWLLPADAPLPWDFTHGAGGTTYVGANWLAEQPDRLRLDLAFQERVGGVTFNAGTPAMPGDTDALDSIPTFPLFEGSPARLSFPGVGIALESGNGGIGVARNTGFYRVSESEDDRDWNGDGDKLDFVLWRTSLAEGLSAFMGVLNDLAGRPAVEYNRLESIPAAAAFITDESLAGAAGTDLNGDGAIGLIVQYFRI